MPIVDQAYYSHEFFGEAVAETDFPKFEATAERAINSLSRGAVAEYPRLPARFQTALKTAICEQIQYYALYGIDLASAGRQAGGFTVGKVRIDGARAGQTGAASTICAGAISALEQTGLLNRQVASFSPGSWPLGYGIW